MPDSDPIVPAFAQVVGELRAQHGLTQWELSERAGLHRNTPGLLERGEREPSLSTIVALARAFGMSASDLIASAERRSR